MRIALTAISNKKMIFHWAEYLISEDVFGVPVCQ